MYDDGISVLKAGMKRFPRSQVMLTRLARMQDQNDDPAGAAATLQGFMDANGVTTERLYSLSHFYSSAGNEEMSERCLQRLLSIMPDHVGANNDLGYFWADEGVHLDQAEKMIKKALENEPGNAAFQDSLGWLYYKQGRFGQAVTVLQDAAALPEGNEAEVIQHLGDALYRVGKRAEAVERWSQANEMLVRVGSPTKAEAKLKAYLGKVIQQTKAGQDATVSPTAESSAGKSAGTGGADTRE
jgi:Tfp pilus assembly protein PilF